MTEEENYSLNGDSGNNKKIYDLMLDIVEDDYFSIKNPLTKFECCSAKMSRINDYELMCSTCGALMEYTEDFDPKYRRKIYDRKIYFRKHLFLILCISGVRIKEVVHKAMSRENPKYINSIYKVRNILTKAKLNRYYIIAPMLLCKYGMMQPPTYRPSEIIEICRLYTQIDYIFLADQKRQNSVFYGFIIYKIIQVLYDDERLAEIVKFIYLPDVNTLIKCIRFWETIREKMNLPKKSGFIVN